MTLVALALALTAPVQEPETTTFQDDLLNVSFSHPKDWRVAKRDKRLVRFDIPVSGEEDKGSLEIIRSAYRGTTDTWQTLQLRTNELSKNTVVRQWEQTVLDAPMLFTQVEVNEKGRRVTRLTGLFYTKTPLKLLFNLSVPTSKFDDARYQFNKVLESMRTIDGTNFAAEDPNKPAETVKPTPVAPKNTVDDGKGKTSGTVKLKNQLEVPFGPQKTLVKYRDGWTAELKEAVVSFGGKRIAGNLTAELGTSLDSSPISVLRTKSGESLAAFTKVARREDHEAERNEAGALVSYVWRRGDGANGQVQSLDAVVVSGELYLVLHYTGNDPKRFDSEQSAINELLRQITVEPAP